MKTDTNGHVSEIGLSIHAENSYLTLWQKPLVNSPAATKENQ